MIKTKFIFLDIDGVLATENTFNSERFLIEDKIQMPYQWCKEACNALSLILDTSGAKIILTSDWRRHYTFDEIKSIFQYYSIDSNSLIGFTDIISKSIVDYESNRTLEINKWIEINKIGSNNYCVIDDMLLSTNNLVHIKDTSEGLFNKDIIEQVFKYLMK